MSNKKTLTRRLSSWHRYTGLGVALIAIHLSITGIFLNHTSDFGLDKIYISNSTIMKWYGIELPEYIDGYTVNNQWISSFNSTLYFNDKNISHNESTLIGAIKTKHFYALATTDEIWLLTIDGEVIEKLNSPSEKLGDIISLGVQNQAVTIKTDEGVFKADNELIAWQLISADDVAWSQSERLPDKLTQNLFNKGHSISWERLLLDLHSGRIATTAGTLLVDLAGVVILFLSITGFIIWLKRRNKRR